MSVRAKFKSAASIIGTVVFAYALAKPYIDQGQVNHLTENFRKEMDKLNTMIAHGEVTLNKVRRDLEQAGSNYERLREAFLHTTRGSSAFDMLQKAGIAQHSYRMQKQQEEDRAMANISYLQKEKERIAEDTAAEKERIAGSIIPSRAQLPTALTNPSGLVSGNK